MPARTRRVAVDQDGDWLYHMDFTEEGAPLPPEQDYVVLSQEIEYEGGMPPIYYTADSSYADITVWANGLISFFPPTPEQIAFMANLDENDDPRWFPGAFIAVAFPSDSSQFTIGIKAGLISVVWDRGEVSITPERISFSEGFADVVTGFRLNGTAYTGVTDFYLSDLIVVQGTHDGNVLAGGPAAETITGYGGNDRLSGGDGGDRLDGDEGDDRLDGGAHSDRLFGGGGNDVLLPGAGADRIDGGDGIDLVALDYSGLAGQLVFELPPAGGTLFDGKVLESVEALELRAGNGSDRIQGGAHADRLYGNAGYDRLYGNAGNDLLDAGLGGPNGGAALIGGGGAGNSIATALSIDDLFQRVAVWDVEDSANTPHVTIADTIRGQEFTHTRYYSITVGANGHLIVDIDGIDVLRDAYTDVQLFDGAGNFVAAGTGNDADPGSTTDRDAWLDIGNLAAGIYYIAVTAQIANIELYNDYAVHISLDTASYLTGNRLEGGAGDDSYYVNSSADQVVELAGEGADTVYSTASFSLAGSHVEKLVLTGTANIDGIGNALANDLTGNGRNNLLDGGAGADTMRGGAGDDRYLVDHSGDRIVELNGEGGDTVNASVSFSLLGQYVEVLNLTGDASINGTGNGLANRLVGNAAANVLYGLDGNDRLDGGAGADRMRGGTGNDVIVVDHAGDLVEESDGEGLDTVEAWIGYSLVGRFVESLKLMGNANLGATGNGLVNELIGNAGNNVLNGMGGADVMRGGAGDDLYIVDNVGDRIFEETGAGRDIVQASVSFSLAGQFVDELQLTGSAAINGSGNGQNNVLRGNDAANVLRGEAGGDSLHGGLGIDTLYGGGGKDSFWFQTALGASNVDTIGDFNVADDTIQLHRGIFTGIAAAGTLAAGAFRLGTAALDADDRILYDAATGNLWYDRDGAGGTAAILFAKLSAGLALTHADFVAAG